MCKTYPTFSPTSWYDVSNYPSEDKNWETIV
jgi:hypothetical protein